MGGGANEKLKNFIFYDIFLISLLPYLPPPNYRFTLSQKQPLKVPDRYLLLRSSKFELKSEYLLKALSSIFIKIFIQILSWWIGFDMFSWFHLRLRYAFKKNKEPQVRRSMVGWWLVNGWSMVSQLNLVKFG